MEEIQSTQSNSGLRCLIGHWPEAGAEKLDPWYRRANTVAIHQMDVMNTVVMNDGKIGEGRSGIWTRAAAMAEINCEPQVV